MSPGSYMWLERMQVSNPAENRFHYLTLVIGYDEKTSRMLMGERGAGRGASRA